MYTWVTITAYTNAYMTLQLQIMFQLPSVDFLTCYFLVQ